MRRTLLTLLLTLASFVAAVSVAFAESDAGHDGGEGIVGETDDKIVTNFGFVLIAAFPVIILVASLIQGKLDKRKDARKKAAKARAARADVRGGW
jgi:preprotein translocase subunit SecG